MKKVFFTKQSFFSRIFNVLIMLGFLLNNLTLPNLSISPAYAQSIPITSSTLNLLNASSAFSTPMLTAIKINPDNPLDFEFLIDLAS